jgi:hypothetical protein
MYTITINSRIGNVTKNASFNFVELLYTFYMSGICVRETAMAAHLSTEIMAAMKILTIRIPCESWSRERGSDPQNTPNP